MLSIKELAALLLIGHFSSMLFIIRVLYRQFRLFKIRTTVELNHFRKVLFTLSIVIMIGNVIPISIDILTLFINLGRPTHIRLISVLYALSNAVVEFASAYLVWKLYQLAARNPEVENPKNLKRKQYVRT
jgi:hypothetical protein